MNNQRPAALVVQQLLDKMNETVKSYHSTVERTGTTVDKIIQGTSMFPGGSGLWRGPRNGGPLPSRFPDHSVMFVGHNFDSIKAYQRSHRLKGEVTKIFWKKLLQIVKFATLTPEECFFTNALMGLKPGSATGSMPTVPNYAKECTAYLAIQAKIVRPKAVIALGENAIRYVSTLNDYPTFKIRHPGDWHFRELKTRQERLEVEGRALGVFLSSCPIVTHEHA